MKTVIPYRYILELPIFEYGCLMELIINEETKQRQGAVMRQTVVI